MTKRFAAYILAALMILGTLPLIVSAAGEDTFYNITADAGFVFTVYNEETEDDEEVTKAIPAPRCISTIQTILLTLSRQDIISQDTQSTERLQTISCSSCRIATS